MATSTEQLHLVNQTTLDLLQRLGILFHPGKCELTPTTSISFLGMQLDIPNQLFKLTEKQHEKIRSWTSILLADVNK